jgi:hypothetical protein
MAPQLAHSFVLVTAAAWGLPHAVGQGLQVEASVVGSPQPPEQQQVLRATVRNRGPRPVEVFVPEHQGLVPFPSWELRDEHGAVVRPEAPPFQSQWVVGLQGEVLELAPGAEASFETRVQLQPGNWTATCTLARERAEVPWGQPGFKLEARPWPTLWTGSVESAPISLFVDSFTTPRLAVSLPDEAVLGAPCVAQCELTWPATAGPVPRRLAVLDRDLVVDELEGRGPSESAPLLGNDAT